MIPFAALERVEVLRDGASSLYGSRRGRRRDQLHHEEGLHRRHDHARRRCADSTRAAARTASTSASASATWQQGRLQRLRRASTTRNRTTSAAPQRPFNTRYAGGLSPTTSPANYYQGGASGNPAAPDCTSAPNLIPGAGGTSCQMTTSSFVDYIPKSERITGLLKGTFKLNENHELGVEYLASESKVAQPDRAGAVRRPDPEPRCVRTARSTRTTLAIQARSRRTSRSTRPSTTACGDAGAPSQASSTSSGATCRTARARTRTSTSSSASSPR